MSRNVRIESKLADEGMGTEPEFDSQRFPAKASGISDDDSRRSLDVFAGAVKAIGEPGKVAAPMLGISDSHLSEMKSGARAITLPRLVGMIQRNRKFGVSLIRALAHLVGGLEVRERGRVDKAQLRKQVEIKFQENPAIFRLVLGDAARELGIDEDEAASVWDGPTLVDAIK